MGKVVVIIGQIASGKTTLAKYMSENGFERIVPYTTRPKRDGEKHGADYWFISSDEFAYYSERGYFAEETPTRRISVMSAMEHSKKVSKRRTASVRFSS